MSRRRPRGLFCALFLCFGVFVTKASEAKTSWVSVDEYDRPTPHQHYYFNRTGGDRGELNTSDASYQWNGDSTTYTAGIYHKDPTAGWTWAGMWYSLIRVNDDHIPLNFNAIFGRWIQPAYQGRVTGIEVVIDRASSAEGFLNLELKDVANNLVAPSPWKLSDLGTKTYPYTWFVDLTSAGIGNVQYLNWILDKAQVGDFVKIDRLRLRVETPDMPTPDEAFLWSYAWLLGNYSPVTGMVQDRSNFLDGTSENVSATGKAAKVAAYAGFKGFTSSADVNLLITKMADTLLTKVPRGPSGINALWPHFTTHGGVSISTSTEWASGDTAYAALDLMTALQWIGDPQKQLPALQTFLTDIDWQALRQATSSGAISHGYAYDGTPLASGWDTFGMETVGVNWAYAGATGQMTPMLPPPSFNGSGFIDNAQYPQVLSRVDAWGNNWDVYRTRQAALQVGWYTPANNSFLANARWFGLSAGEVPEADDQTLPNDQKYKAYGIGGMTAPEDGNGEVVLLHYSGMIADLAPTEAAQMWTSLCQTGDLSPLNNIESLRVNAATGERRVNWLKGSWNLALQAEGWALSDPAIRSALSNAVNQNSFLRRGAELLKSSAPPPVLEVTSPHDQIPYSNGQTMDISWTLSGWPSSEPVPTTISLRHVTTPDVEALRLTSSAMSVNGHNHFYWPVPPGIQGRDWIVHVELNGASPAVADDVDGAFVIFDHSFPGGVKIWQPNGGEVLHGGDTFTIVWLVGANALINTPQLTTLTMHNTAGTEYWSVASNLTSVPGINSYLWTIPNNLSGRNMRLHVQMRPNFNSVLYDDSDGDITVMGLAPFIAGSGTARGTVGEAFAYQITATNDPTRFSAQGLPTSLSINADGLISGIPVAAATTTVTLRAANAIGTGSAQLQIIVDPPVIKPPSQLTFSSADYAALTLSWLPPAGPIHAEGYRLDVSSVSTFASLLPGYNNQSLGKETTTVLTGLQTNTTYYARLRAVDAVGNISTDSLTAIGATLNDVTAPSAPEILSNSEIFYSSFTLYWTASTDNVGVTTYHLDLSSSPVFAFYQSNYQDQNIGNVLTATPTGLLAGTTYYVRLRAYDWSGNASLNSTTRVTLIPRDSVSPAFAFISPTNGAEVSGAVPILPSAIETFGGAKVSFLVDDVLQWTDTAAPHNYNWDASAVPVGPHQLELKIYNADNVVQSAKATVIVTSPGGVTSGPGRVGEADPFVSLRVYPNPWRSGRDQNRDIIFDQIPAESTVKIFTISAGWVATLMADSSGVARWNLRNQKSDSVSSGLYLFLVTDPDGHQAHGKFAIIR